LLLGATVIDEEEGVGNQKGGSGEKFRENACNLVILGSHVEKMIKRNVTGWKIKAADLT